MRSFVLLMGIGLGSTGIPGTAFAAGDMAPAPLRVLQGQIEAATEYQPASRNAVERADSRRDALEAELSMRAIQRLLNRLGFEAGVVDGVLGAQTRSAIAAYQETRGLEPTGEADAVFNAQLHQDILLGHVDRPAGAVIAAGPVKPVAFSAEKAMETPVAPGTAPQVSEAEKLAAPEALSGSVCSTAGHSAALPAVVPPELPESAVQRAVWEFFTITRDIVISMIRTFDGDSGSGTAGKGGANATVVAAAETSRLN